MRKKTAAATNIECLILSATVLSTSHELTHIIFTRTLGTEYYYCLCFTKGKTEQLAKACTAINGKKIGSRT